MILAIDLGSTNFKAAAFTAELERLGGASVATPYHHRDGERVEMNAADVRRETLALIQSACRDAGCRTTDLGTIAITSQAQNVVVLDGAGRARTHVTSWLDTRATREAEALMADFGEDWHTHASMGSLSAQMQLSHLLWFHRHQPESLEGDIRIVSLPGLIFHLLAGVNLTDDNLAAMSGCYSLKQRDWRADILERCGVDVSALPRIVPVGSHVQIKSRCSELALANEIDLVAAGNDQTAGAYGNGCGNAQVVVTLGTALVAYQFAGQTIGPYHTGCFWGPYPGGGYYELAVDSEGCLALDWARETLAPGQTLKAFDEVVARSRAGVTKQMGFFYPSQMRSSHAWQGAFKNAEEKAYAVLEGLTFALRRLLEEEFEWGRKKALRVIGGGSHSMVWLQLIADALDCEVVQGSGDSLLGAAAMAAGCAAPQGHGPRFSPDANQHQRLDARWLRWREWFVINKRPYANT